MEGSRHCPGFRAFYQNNFHLPRQMHRLPPFETPSRIVAEEKSAAKDHRVEQTFMSAVRAE